MKKQRKSLMLIALLLLVGITAGRVASTYAKYTAKVEGEGSATVAKWAFDTENSTTQFDVTLDGTYDATTLVADKIAPGTKGYFEVKLTNAQSEVGVDFTVEVGTATNKPTNLKFYKDAGYTTELVPGTDSITGQIAQGDATGLKVKVYWKWVYETGTVTNGIAAGDDADTTNGKNAASLTVPLTVKGVQREPGAATTTHIN